MLSKLKNAFNQIKEEQIEQQKRKIDISILNGEQVKVYRKLMDKFKQNVQELQQISRTNRQDLIEFIKQQTNKQKQISTTQNSNEEQNYIFTQDLKQMKDILKDVFKQLQEITKIQTQIKNRVQAIQQNQSADKVNQLNAYISRLEIENKNYKTSQQNNKQILSTLKQQTQLYMKQLKDIQEKNKKIQKQLIQKTSLIQNLKQQKIVLLQMRNNDNNLKNPQIQALKGQLLQFEKRLVLQKTKYQQKQKQIQVLKKKLQQDRQSLQKIADQLKNKQLQSKKILDKYDRSKTQIRKYRQQKTQFIKKLNLQNSQLILKINKINKDNQNLNIKIKQQQNKIEQLQTNILKNQNRSAQLQSIKIQLLSVRKQLLQKNLQFQEYGQQMNKMKNTIQLLQGKRKQLIQSLQKPVNHQIKTLEKIIKALEKLYKQYISTVFQQGNIVGFETKISHLISNVQEIKQDLLL